MRPIRFQISGLMIAVALVAILLVTLVRPTPLGTSLCFSTAVASFLLALVIALVGRGSMQVMAIGFVVCGVGHFLIGLVSQGRLITLAVASWLAWAIPNSDRESFGWSSLSLLSLGIGALGARFARWLTQDQLHPPRTTATEADLVA